MMPKGKRETAFYVIYDSMDVDVIPTTAEFRERISAAKFHAHPDEQLAAQGYALTPEGGMVLILKGKPVALATKVVVA